MFTFWHWHPGFLGLEVGKTFHAVGRCSYLTEEMSFFAPTNWRGSKVNFLDQIPQILPLSSALVARFDSSPLKCERSNSSPRSFTLDRPLQTRDWLPPCKEVTRASSPALLGLTFPTVMRAIEGEKGHMSISIGPSGMLQDLRLGGTPTIRQAVRESLGNRWGSHFRFPLYLNSWVARAAPTGLKYLRA